MDIMDTNQHALPSSPVTEVCTGHMISPSVGLVVRQNGLNRNTAGVPYFVVCTAIIMTKMGLSLVISFTSPLATAVDPTAVFCTVYLETLPVCINYVTLCFAIMNGCTNV